MPATTSSNSFSHSLNLIDLNDYLGPSQLCTKPNIPTTQEQQQPSLSKTQILLDDHPPPSTKVTESLPKAQITLNDCLACSGCITSSESILVSLQSVLEVRKEIQQPNRYPIVSISSHSLASFVAYNQLDSLSTGFKVLKKYFTRSHNFALVLDTSFSQRLHLLESQREFKEHRRRQKEAKVSGGKAPLLASSCPAWICYAEKTQGKNGILEMISRVKSAQQIQGSLLKSPRFAESVGLGSAEPIYHVCVMSCYDKKLEASRPDFQSDEGIKDVDCVLTTREVQEMIQEDGFDILQAAQETEESGQTLDSQVGIPIWIDHPPPIGSSSGGYLFNLLRASVPTDRGNIIDRLRLTVDRKRGSDYVEYRLQLAHTSSSQDIQDVSTQEPETLFYGALFYGFKNLQNLIRKIAPPSSSSTTNPRARIMGRRRKDQGVEAAKEADRTYDFVEVMACPSGCVNGGGQIPLGSQPGPSSSAPTNKQLIAKLEQVYFQSSSPSCSPEEAQQLKAAANDQQADLVDALQAADLLDSHEHTFILSWLGSWGFLSDQASRDRTFLTSYRAVEPESNGLAVQW
ncbi:Cytosolic Fe-S cluster assembly factor nar1 [Puccinia graminis f. sp. tritici]|uniref:Cytosolic Fe-S cluster assembly factor nar1 n=1 Tax=Puccinia graminis f. sp. tritici TaxID=56615 RepID=A0A5B0S3D2_PUCGR|nr:Cytosolic Fe-S cluster assembly factor nar1 [Puccinia graminis f. sp. tritici]